MKGNCNLIIQVAHPGDGLPAEEDIKSPGVEIFNDQDVFYHTVFETRLELERFMASLNAIADQAFGPRTAQVTASLTHWQEHRS